MYTKNITTIDRHWILTFFGTAIGAGILFLPVQAGLAGIFVVIISMIAAAAATYYSQKFFTVFIVRAKNPESFDTALASYWGKAAAIGITAFWAVTFFLPLTIYTTAISANASQFLMDYSPVPINLFGNPLLPLCLLTISHSFS